MINGLALSLVTVRIISCMDQELQMPPLIECFINADLNACSVISDWNSGSFSTDARSSSQMSAFNQTGLQQNHFVKEKEKKSALFLVSILCLVRVSRPWKKGEGMEEEKSSVFCQAEIPISEWHWLCQTLLWYICTLSMCFLGFVSVVLFKKQNKTKSRKKIK